MAMDIFDDDDRLVDQQPEAENQCKEGDPVDRLSGQETHAERDEEREGNRGCHNKRFAPAQDHEQDNDDHDRLDQTLNELVDGIVGLCPVISCDRDADARGHFRVRDRGQNAVSNAHRIRSGLLRDGKVDGRLGKPIGCACRSAAAELGLRFARRPAK